ncbi:MAG: hypothetical protein JWP02_2835, partial [Acidimicrobiales bacterium]|nr:hypothetical protein [Acidimicrobiales bacterium]
LHSDRVRDIATTLEPVVAIDTFVDENGLGPVDLVKIDTEKTEPAVLEGMLRTIARDRPSIVCEVLDRENGKAIEEILTPFGYRWYFLTWMGPLERDEITPGNVRGCLNYLFSTAEQFELVALLDEVQAALE